MGSNCPECGHAFYNDWELIHHANGRHHYRSWTREDGRRQAELRKRSADPLWPTFRGVRTAA